MEKITHNIQLRQATPSDSDFVYQVKKAALGEYIEKTWGWNEAFQLEYHRKDFDPSVIQIVTVEDTDVGWVVFTQSDDEIQVSEIYLLPEYHRQGIGSHLISQLLAEAQGRGAPVTLRVLKVNPARKFYENRGFAVTGETDTHYLMAWFPCVKGDTLEPETESPTLS